MIERIAAGDLPNARITAGQVAYITTGSPVPEGADAVVKIEDTEGILDEATGSQEVQVKILKAVKTGVNIRPVGSDIKPNELLVDAKEIISAAEIGLLATVSGRFFGLDYASGSMTDCLFQ